MNDFPIVRAAADPRIVARVTEAHALEGVAGGSALLAVGKRLLVAHDDAYRATWIDLPSLATTHVALRGGGEPLPKATKPDFEAAVAGPDGAIYLLGSGSAGPRCEIARIGADGAVEIVTHDALYGCIAAALRLAARPNVEGAIVVGERLRLFHRGVGAARSATVDVPLGVLRGEPPVALEVRWYELGSLAGVGVAFTDAAPLPDGRAAFTAAAENTLDAVLDGPVAGSVIGSIDARTAGGSARWGRLWHADGRPLLDKVEGLAIDEHLRSGWLLTDADAPGSRARLLRLQLAGFD
jgi:hypothetical protein